MPGQAHHAAHRLHDHVEGGPRRVGPGLAEARDRRDDQRRMPRVQDVPAEAELRQHAGPVVLDQNVRARDELGEDRAVAVGGEVERDALLAAVQRHEVGRLAVEERPDLARVVAVSGPLDLDHARAELGQHQRAVRPRQHARQIDHRDSGERAVRRVGCLAHAGRHRSIPGMADSRAAAGPGAVLSTLEQVRELGLVRGLAVLRAREPGRRLRLSGLRLARESAAPCARVLRERREGGRQRGDTEARHSPTSSRASRSLELEAQDDVWLEAQGRLSEPMWRAPGATHYAPIAWDGAFARIASHLQRLASPDEAVFYTSGRTSNEAAFLWQLFARAFGTNNLPDCSNMCHESSGTGLGESIGEGKGTVGLDDFARCDADLRARPEPGLEPPAHAHGAASGQAARLRDRQHQPAARARARRVREPAGGARSARAAARRSRTASCSCGSAATWRCCRASRRRCSSSRTPPRAPCSTAPSSTRTRRASRAGAPRSPRARSTSSSAARASRAPSMRELAELYARSKSVIACWAMGLTQHEHGVANVQELVNLLLLRGNIGRPGAGPCPVRGHSNVQGDRTMGIWERPTPDFLARLGAEFGFAPPRGARPRHGRRDPRAAGRPGQGLHRAWAGTSRARPPTRRSPRRRCAAPSSPCRSRPS